MLRCCLFKNTSMVRVILHILSIQFMSKWNSRVTGGNLISIDVLFTHVSLSRGVERELSLIWRPVQTQILHPRGPKYA